MKAFEIIEHKAFMSALLTKDTFDHFAVSEIKILSTCHFELDGKRNEFFYSEEEKEFLEEEEYVLWSELRPLIYQIIKGKKLPTSFRMVLRLSKKNMINVIKSVPDADDPSQVGGLFLNIQYEHEKLMVTSGTAMKTFSLTKSLDAAWDGYAMKFLKKQQLAFLEV